MTITTKLEEDYLSKREIKNAEEATDRALLFLQRKYPLRKLAARPAKAARENDVWSVDLDVGIIRVLIANFKIDAKTGEVIQYSIPPL